MENMYRVLEDTIEKEVLDLAKAYINLQSEDYLQGNQIVILDKDGKLDEDRSFRILQLPLKNTSELSVSHPIFDSKSVVDNFKM